MRIVAADELIDRHRLEDLQALQPDAFSAATFRCPDGRVIVFNPLHLEGRTRSNIAHEIAHIALDHKVHTIEQVGDLKFLTCDLEQEEEADWLGGCLLLPAPSCSKQPSADSARRRSRRNTSPASTWRGSG